MQAVNSDIPPQQIEMMPPLPPGPIMERPSAEPVIDADQPLPPNARRVISYYGVLQPDYERVTACAGDTCSEAILERASGRILFIHGQWQPGSVETGFGQEVITAVED